MSKIDHLSNRNQINKEFKIYTLLGIILAVLKMFNVYGEIKKREKVNLFKCYLGLLLEFSHQISSYQNQINVDTHFPVNKYSNKSTFNFCFIKISFLLI